MIYDRRIRESILLSSSSISSKREKTTSRTKETKACDCTHYNLTAYLAALGELQKVVHVQDIS